jgi:hypothetical protein
MNARLPRTLLAAVFSCSLLFVIGCGSKGHDRTEVSGMVTLDGEPLPSGLTIKFTPQESGKPVGQGGVDVKSRYFIYGAPGEIGLNPGTYTVSVEVPFADEPGPYSGPPELAKVKIPEAYQTGKSTLTYTAPSGGGTFNIEMVSK